MFWVFTSTLRTERKTLRTLNMKYSSWSTDNKSTVIQPLLCFPASVLLQTKLDALEEVMMNIPHDAYWPFFTFEGQAIAIL